MVPPGSLRFPALLGLIGLPQQPGLKLIDAAGWKSHLQLQLIDLARFYNVSIMLPQYDFISAPTQSVEPGFWYRGNPYLAIESILPPSLAELRGRAQA